MNFQNIVLRWKLQCYLYCNTLVSYACSGPFRVQFIYEYEGLQILRFFLVYYETEGNSPVLKADGSGPRRPGYDSREDITFSEYSMDVMINAPITCLTLNRLQKVGWSEVKQAFKKTAHYLCNPHRCNYCRNKFEVPLVSAPLRSVTAAGTWSSVHSRTAETTCSSSPISRPYPGERSAESYRWRKSFLSWKTITRWD